MGVLLSYSILSGINLLLLWLVYKIFISRDNQPDFNRGILLSIYFVSFSAVPFYTLIEFYRTLKAESTLSNIEMNTFFEEIKGQPLWGTILIWIFIIGMALVFLKTALTWFRIVRLINSGKKIKKKGYNLVLINNDTVAPFTWMHYMVLGPNDIMDNSPIITHELKHIRSFHWLDLIMAEFICIINWFNPAAWLMRDELKLVHEYQADMAVLRAGYDPQEYQNLLIKKAVGSRFPSLTNSLNHSKLKKRITMMYKSKSGERSKLKTLALVPTISLAFFVISTPIVEGAVSTISNSKVSLNKSNENLSESTGFRIISLNDSGIETTVVVKGEDLGNSLTVSGGNFINKGKIVPAKSLSTNMTNGNATITAVFPTSDSYENASISFNVNGKEIKLNLDKFNENSESNSITVSSSNGIVISKGNTTLSTIGDMEIYLNDKKISEEEMKSLNPEIIASITFDNQKNQIKIISQ